VATVGLGEFLAVAPADEEGRHAVGVEREEAGGKGQKFPGASCQSDDQQGKDEAEQHAADIAQADEGQQDADAAAAGDEAGVWELRSQGWSIRPRWWALAAMSMAPIAPARKAKKIADINQLMEKLGREK